MLSELLFIQLSCFVWYLEKEFKNVFTDNLYINDCLEKYVIFLCIEMRKTHSKFCFKKNKQKDLNMSKLFFI